MSESLNDNFFLALSPFCTEISHAIPFTVYLKFSIITSDLSTEFEQVKEIVFQKATNP
jgi:hypothetical protein